MPDVSHEVISAPSVGDLDEVRQLLRAADQAELVDLRARVAELERTLALIEVRPGDVARVLPAAIESSDQTSQDLNDALRPQVYLAIHRSSREDPELVAEALYPVLGRAVRMIVANMFTRDNAHGRSFTVDQLFLIERESGLPMWSVTSDGADNGNADVVSGMLEAIRSFVQDSFEAQDHDGMRQLAVGEVSVWVEWGPEAVLAAVIRGPAPDEYRLQMQALLEMLHIRYADELSSFEGDPSHLAAVEPHLLELQRARGIRGTSRSLPIPGPAPLAAALALVLVAVIAIVVVMSVR